MRMFFTIDGSVNLKSAAADFPNILNKNLSMPGLILFLHIWHR